MSSIADRVKAINALKKQANELGVEVTNAPKELESFPQLGFGTCKVNGKWALIEIGYNPETLEAKVTKIAVDEEGKTGVSERFKIEAALRLPVFNPDVD
jgi:hypothetical protein